MRRPWSASSWWTTWCSAPPAAGYLCRRAADGEARGNQAWRTGPRGAVPRQAAGAGRRTGCGPTGRGFLRSRASGSSRQRVSRANARASST